MVEQGRLGIAILLAATLSLPNSALADSPAAAPSSAWSATQGDTPAIALPLDSGEKVVPFANGCSTVSNSPGPVVRSTASWYGNCRFGLAHGDGVEQSVANKFRARWRYQYGVVIGGTDTDGRMSWPYMYLEKDGVLLSNVREDGRRDWVLIQSPDSNVGTLTAGHIVSMLVAEPGMNVVDVFTPIALECANNGKVNWRGLSISAPDASAADADCERHWVARGMKSKAGMLMIRSADYIAYIHHEHRAEPIDGTAPTKKISAHYCSGGSQSSDCTRVLHELLRPLAPRIQAIIDGQRRQYAEGLPWLTARYAPLEAERLTQWRALAARYATRPRPPVGTLTSRPVAKSPAKKGRRN